MFGKGGVSSGRATQLASKVYVGVLACLLAFFFIFSGVNLTYNLNKKTEAFNSTYAVAANATVVGELWNNGKWNKNNVKTFFNMLSNSNTGSMEMIETNVGNSTINAGAIRSYGGGGKTAGKSLVVTIGGIQWVVTYLSRAKSSMDRDGNSKGDIIATLWMADSTTTSTFGSSSRYVGSSIDGDDYDMPTTDGIQTSFYGTSYVRAVTLNQGGAYLNLTDNYTIYDTPNATATQKANHQWAEFTMPTGDFTPYIVTPEYVTWQEAGQRYMNDNWASNYPSYNAQYSWKDDTIWLPSMTEAGYDDGDIGMWCLNEAERCSSDSSGWCWSRSGNNAAFSVRFIYADSDRYGPGDSSMYAFNRVCYNYGIRPAFHLNLSHIDASIPIEIGLDLDGGRGTTSLEVLKGKALPTITPPTKEGYNFEGFYLRSGGSGTQYYSSNGEGLLIYPSSGGATTLYAYWTPINYTVSFNSNKGLGSMADMSFVYNVAKNFTANAYTRAGYTFSGWATSESGAVVFADKANVSNLTANDNETVVLYAIWFPITYTVKFNGNGTPGEMRDMTFTYDIAQNLTANAFLRVGYDFKGWATSENGSVVYKDKQSVKNLTDKNNEIVNLYAILSPITYVVRFDNNGGSGVMPDMDFVYGQAQILTANTFTRNSGSEFLGWSLTSSGAVDYQDKQNVKNLAVEQDKIVVLYAVWKVWLSISAIGSTTGFTFDAEHSEKYLSATAVVKPTIGYYAYEISFDNINWTQIKFYATEFFDLDFCGSVRLVASIKNNKLTFTFEGIDADYIKSEPISVYLKFNQTPYTKLTAGTSSVSGVAVSSTFGGMAAVLGDPFGEEPLEGEEITLRATITADNYGFVGWCLADDLETVVYHDMSVKVEKAEVMGKQLVAVFKPVDNDYVNTDTNN